MSLSLPTNFARQVLDSLPARVAVLDEVGTIVAVNAAWTQFARANGNSGEASTGVGVNYLATCRNVVGDEESGAASCRDGVTAVLQGNSDYFEMEYLCHAPDERRWYLLQIMPLVESPRRWAVVSHTSVMARRHAVGRATRGSVDRALAQAELEFEEARTAQRSRERQAYGVLSAGPGTNLTARSFGERPLREEFPHLFAHAVECYEILFDRALERRGYRVDFNLSDSLRELAGELGFARARPRDVVEIHTAALRNRSRGAPPQKVQVLAEEGNFLVVELMGYLATYYRSQGLGIGPGSIPASPPSGDDPRG